ncbi:hypothetical protein E4U32_006764 [Claviceps aff. humidiphila group G2b]|nr:hypothetical protein E4U32_006764 [Claviceps aff. humidiphila group G2b]
MSDSPTTARALAALDPDDFEGYDEVWRDQRRRERDRTPPRNEPLNDEPKPGLQTASNLHTGPFKLSSGGENKALFSEMLQFNHKIPIYPNTHPMGYTYVVPAQLVDDVDKLPLQLGLTIKAPHGKKQTRCPFLGLDVPCARYRYICQGIKMCRKARPELRDYSWRNLTIADWTQLEQWRSKVDLYEPNERLQRASGWYHNHKNLFFQGAACNPQLPSCRPRVHKASISDDTGPYYTSVRCINYHSETGRGHVRKDLGPQTVIDVDYLQRLFDHHHETAPTDLCGTWDTNQRKKRQCDDYVAYEALKSALNEVGLRTLAAGNPEILQGNRIENLIQFWKIDTYPCGPDLIEEEVSDRRNLDSYHEYGIHDKQANRSGWNKHYLALRREVNKKRKREELQGRVQENPIRQGGESSAFSEADLEDMHSSGATRMPAGQPPAPRTPSPLVGQDQNVRPTIELQSSFQYPAGFTLPPSQGRDNNGRSLASRTHEQTLMDGYLAEKQRLANEAERLRQAGIVQRQEFNQRLMSLREEFIRTILRRIEAGETEFDPRIFDLRMFELC